MSDFGFWAAVGASILGCLVFRRYADRKRRRTLHRRADGVFVWEEWHGMSRSAHRDPSAPGGAWDSSSGADGAGDGGGGDGSGD